MIPARFGSTRLKLKNMALINSKPMISYSILAAKESGIFDKVFVNSDHEIFRKISDRYKVDFYLRPKDIGSSTAKSDSVVYDFIKKHPNIDIVVWVNPIAPLQTKSDIKSTVNYFLENNLDSLITVEEHQVHAMYKNKPINYSKTEVFAQTQDIDPISTFSYSIMMWNAETFLREFEDKGFALFCGNFGVKSVGKLSSIVVKTERDLMIVDAIIKGIEQQKQKELKYDPLVDDFLLQKINLNQTF